MNTCTQAWRVYLRFGASASNLGLGNRTHSSGMLGWVYVVPWALFRKQGLKTAPSFYSMALRRRYIAAICVWYFISGCEMVCYQVVDHNLRLREKMRTDESSIKANTAGLSAPPWFRWIHAWLVGRDLWLFGDGFFANFRSSVGHWAK